MFLPTFVVTMVLNGNALACVNEHVVSGICSRAVKAVEVDTTSLISRLPSPTLAATPKPSCATPKPSWTPKPTEGCYGVQVASSNYLNAYLLNNGEVWTAGYNDNGQLGRGCEAMGKWGKVDIKDVGQISVGEDHILLLHANGTVSGFGDNDDGQLGLGTKTEKKCTPQNIKALTNVKAVSAGVDFSLVLFHNGTVMATGNNYYGMLGVGFDFGDSNGTWYTVPLPGKATAISAGGYHSLFLLEDKRVFVAGYGSDGRLGTAIYDVEAWGPVQVTDDAVAIVANYQTSTILKSDGSVYSFGDNEYCATGLVPEDEIFSPLKVALPSEVKNIFGGPYAYGTAFLLELVDLYVAGYSSNGSLGLNTSKYQVCGPEKQPLEANAASLGEYNIGILVEGLIYFAGNNEYNQIDASNTTSYSTPQRVGFSPSAPCP